MDNLFVGHKNEVPGEDATSPVALRQVSFLNNTEDSPRDQNSSTGISNNHINPAFEGDDVAGSKKRDSKIMSEVDPPREKDPEAGIVFKSPNNKYNATQVTPNSRTRHKSDGQQSGSSMDEDEGGRSEFSGNVKFEDELYDDLDGLSLCYSRHEKVALKNFSNEVRASRDVQRYLRNMALLLNLNTSDLDQIIDQCLLKTLGNSNPQVFDQAKAALVTHDCVHQLSRTICSTCQAEGGGFSFDQNWIAAMCAVPSLTTKHVAIARLLHPANLGENSKEISFVILILGPTKEKGTKNELEVARTFGTIFANISIRQELLGAHDEEEFREILQRVVHTLSIAHSKKSICTSLLEEKPAKLKCGFMKGIYGDLKRRLPHYASDYKDGVSDLKSVTKTLSCTLFLYFACILPSIAFGVLNASNTDNILSVEKVLCSQVFGGLFFAIFGGTPQIVLLTTAPLALYTQIIFTMSEEYDLNFQAFFGCVGLFNCLFLVIFSVFDLSILMQFSTRSSEEIFALFISIAFSVDAFKDFGKNVDKYYNCDLPDRNVTTNSSIVMGDVDCPREISLLYLLLLLGTLWLGVTLFQFKNTPYLTPGKREMMADYALPVSVIIMGFIGAYGFQDIDIGKSFETTDEEFSSLFKFVDLSSLSWKAILGACGLGFCLSLLFFMDQNISAALVNAPQNKMQKGTAYHWDLLIIAAINTILSLLCFPWVHAALPHSPLHVMALADVEERVDQGHIYQIVVKVRETRLTCIFSHILIAVSFFFLFVLAYIPAPVLYGLFLYVAVTAVFGNQMFERIQLFFTEQSAYPPNHYIRRVPQRKMHLFTALQIIQLLILCGVGFAPYPYLKMFFPVLIFCLIPIRHKVIPKLISQKYLKAMDGH